MNKIVVRGKRTLQGTSRVHGAKNAVLPVLAATVLNGGESVIEDCPGLCDVDASIHILQHLGCSVKQEGQRLIINSATVNEPVIPDRLMHEMRSSIIFLGAVAARCGWAKMTMPGGCELGPRPIDLHLKAFRKLGLEITENGGEIYAVAKRLRPAKIHLDLPSVGATENIMLLASSIEGTTVITNAAKEPEIEDLQAYINAIGGKIIGAGTGTVQIEGVKRFGPAIHRVMPDRIVAATYLIAAMITGGQIVLDNVCPAHMRAVLAALADCGAHITEEQSRIVLKAPQRILPLDILRTSPHPGFPTDAQAILVSMLSVADGTSLVVENIFESRFQYASELARMGADITVDGRMAVIRGVKGLTGAKVSAMDLRGGAALVTAALAAEGETEISEIHHIERGYYHFTEELSALGADIKLQSDVTSKKTTEKTKTTKGL